ncbi:hypothetical protein ACJX0J_032111, partial [Zea mays]
LIELLVFYIAHARLSLFNLLLALLLTLWRERKRQNVHFGLFGLSALAYKRDPNLQLTFQIQYFEANTIIIRLTVTDIDKNSDTKHLDVLCDKDICKQKNENTKDNKRRLEKIKYAKKLTLYQIENTYLYD